MIYVNLFDKSFQHLFKSDGAYSMVHERVPNLVRYASRQMVSKLPTIFTDHYILSDVPQQVKCPKKIAWLVETREISPHTYAKIRDHESKYDLILTHDENLLRCGPKYSFMPFGGTWIKPHQQDLYLQQKKNMCSMIYSDKKFTIGHKMRHAAAICLRESKANCSLFGSGTGVRLPDKADSLKTFKFSVVIENVKKKNYFTEKLLDCFATGTIPIYWGCENIRDFFSLGNGGIIEVNSPHEIVEKVLNLSDQKYMAAMNDIKSNMVEMKEYEIPEDYMAREGYLNV